MFKLPLFFLCVQILVFKTVYSQYTGCGKCQALNYGVVGSSCGSPNIGCDSVPSYSCGSSIGNGFGLVGTNAGFSASIGNAGGFGFGGVGTGQLVIEGGVPIVGNTYVEGNLPILGLVEFIGSLPACGFVNVCGSTPCECNQYSFGY